MLKRIVIAFATGLLALGLAAGPAAASCGPDDHCTGCW